MFLVALEQLTVLILHKSLKLSLFLIDVVQDLFEVSIQVQLNFVLIVLSVCNLLPYSLLFLFKVLQYVFDMGLQLKTSFSNGIWSKSSLASLKTVLSQHFFNCKSLRSQEN